MKVCTKCGTPKPLDAFRKQATGRCGVRASCRQCDRGANAAWAARESVRQVRAAYMKRYFLEHPEARSPNRTPGSVSATAKRYADKHRDRVRAKDARGREKLIDGYVKDLICGKSTFPREMISPELVELKREQLRLRRLARELKKAAAKEPPNETISQHT